MTCRSFIAGKPGILFPFWCLCGVLMMVAIIGCESGEADSGDITNGGGSHSEVGPNEDGSGDSNGVDLVFWDSNDEKSFVVGTNVTGKAKPAEFSALKEDGDLFVELGFQGSYMVVLALQTRGYVTEKVKITARLVADGQQKAALTIKNKKLVPGGNGYDYWYNIFVVTEDYVDYQNTQATVTLALYDAESDALVVEDSVQVFIRPPK